ncbi:DNA-processing protein DprA [Bacteroidota bacterium]
MEADSLLKYKIAMNIIPGIGCIIAKRIIAHTGGVDAIFHEKKKNLLKIPGIGKYLAYRINTKQAIDKAEEEIEFLKKNKIDTLFYLDENFPERLRHCEDGPIVIFSRGKINFNNQKVLSVIGTRSASPRGREICEKIISDLSENGHNLIIVSGLAYGIDITAHKSALKNSLDTIAVLAHGLDTIYPNLHRNIAKKICTNGALVTEFLSKTKLERNNFIKRNRIIAGLADASLIIESGEKGGAMITADIANSYNREVFTIPGRINDTYSKGCNLLIKSNIASLVEKAEDIEYLLQWNLPEKNKGISQSKLFPDLTIEEKQIIEILKEGPKSIDQISFKSRLQVSKLSSFLLNLEFSGNIKSLPGQIYSLSHML